MLVPEGTLNLAGPARDVLVYLDGRRNIAAIVAELLKQYTGAPQEQMTEDVLSLLNRMEQRGVIRASGE
ncbi:hypothetical protein ACPOL_5432 [Acidisarcina polymorpha]|uniref:Coenzyme PQQ synthesis protein D n=1 Tax=Acidisarcina polymorpha TaxID=2211140 RepID=A0A2Z5G6T1_9BACT|nr:hypothetical protein ACPOL_5432 [Acidisarcina polymorpha]